LKFYDRETELQTLDAMQRLSRSKGARMTVLYGRRRIGKTVLALHSAQQSDVPHVYLFVSRKNEALLCQDAKTEIERGLGTTVHGDFTRFRDVLAWLMDYASRTPLTLIIDEFQEFTTINPAIFSELQEIWDRSKSGSRLHLIISGSVYRLMKSIFEDAREPLFGRADERIHLQPFHTVTGTGNGTGKRTGTLTEIMRSHHPGFTPQDLLCLYAVTGGIPKYVEMLADKGAMTCTAMRDELFRPDSWWLDEGANLLIGEFGREHTTYFSILSLVASGKTSRTEIESVLEKNIGGYLDRLIHDFQILTAVKPSALQARRQDPEVRDQRPVPAVLVPFCAQTPFRRGERQHWTGSNRYSTAIFQHTPDGFWSCGSAMRSAAPAGTRASAPTGTAAATRSTWLPWMKPATSSFSPKSR
jgi:uncharacterized protein